VPDFTFDDGPLDGLTYGFREDAPGVLAVDKEDGIAWLYASPVSSTFALRIDDNADPVTAARPLDADKAVAAAEFGYLVIAVPGDEPDQDDLDAEENLTDGE